MGDEHCNNCGAELDQVWIDDGADEETGKFSGHYEYGPCPDGCDDEVEEDDPTLIDEDGDDDNPWHDDDGDAEEDDDE